MPACLKVLGNDSLRPNKLSAHLFKCHAGVADKDASYFQYLERNLKRSRLDSSGQYQHINEAAATASYEVSYLIAKSLKPHTLAENLILPCAKILTRRMLGENAAKKLDIVPL